MIYSSSATVVEWTLLSRPQLFRTDFIRTEQQSLMAQGLHERTAVFLEKEHAQEHFFNTLCRYLKGFKEVKMRFMGF